MSFIDKLAKYYGLTIMQLNKLTVASTLLDLPDPRTFLHMDETVLFIKSKLKKRAKILIYGDYDCDGIMATSIMVRFLQSVNANFGYYIPSRYKDGYGLNDDMIDLFHKKGYELIITVDNGISQHQAIKHAQNLGIKVIVTDHHERGEVLPMADYILHPLISKYGDIPACGAYVALMLTTALQGFYDAKSILMAAVATISDMMPLREYNRILVKTAMEIYTADIFPAFAKLLGEQEFSEKSIAMTLAPKINAVGRMIEDTKVNYLVQFLTIDDEQKLTVFADWINEINKNRQNEMKNISSGGADEIICHDDAVVVLTSAKEGLIGLLAARYNREYNLPAAVFTTDSNDSEIIKGSLRSSKGINIAIALQQMSDILLAFGGHAAAGGCSLKRDNLTLFAQRFSAFAINHPYVNEDRMFIKINEEDINWENYHILRQLAPFGIGFDEPLLEIGPFSTSNLRYSRNDKHIMTSLGPDRRFLGFNFPRSKYELTAYIFLLGTLEKEVYNQKETLNFRIAEITLANNL